MHNKITLLGRLGQNPEVVTGKSGKEYLHLSLATESWNSRDKIMETDWHRVRVIFPSQVNYLRQRASKGDVVHVVGRLTYNSFTPKESTHRVTIAFILAQDVHLITPRREALPPDGPYDGDIPF